MSTAHSIRRPVYVYFVQAGEDGPIKIGRTTGDPIRRLKDLQTASPYTLRLIGVKETSETLTERLVHQRFAHLSLSGEWFSPAPDLLAFIADDGAFCEVKDSPPRRKGPRCSALRAMLVKPPLPVASSRSRRRPGRRWYASDEEERLKHIRAAGLLLSGKYTPEGIAALHGVHVRTIYRWRDAALTYDDIEAVGLRRLVGLSGEAAG
jgi:hypothetical protein